MSLLKKTGVRSILPDVLVNKWNYGNMHVKDGRVRYGVFFFTVGVSVMRDSHSSSSFQFGVMP